MKNTSDRIVIDIYEPINSDARSPVLRITPEAVEALLQLQRQTRLNKCYLASQIIIQTVEKNLIDFNRHNKGEI